MLKLNPKIIMDKDKRKKVVILSFAEWGKVVVELEELDDIRAYDAAKSSQEETIPFSQAVLEIRENHTM